MAVFSEFLLHANISRVLAGTSGMIMGLFAYLYS